MFLMVGWSAKYKVSFDETCSRWCGGFSFKCSEVPHLKSLRKLSEGFSHGLIMWSVESSSKSFFSVVKVTFKELPISEIERFGMAIFENSKRKNEGRFYKKNKNYNYCYDGSIYAEKVFKVEILNFEPSNYWTRT